MEVHDYESNYGTGWIKIYRSIRDHWIFENPMYLKAWIFILLEVNHSPKPEKIPIKGSFIYCGRGQKVYSLRTWVTKLGDGWSMQKVRTFFKLLKKDNMIFIENLKNTTRITVCNYDTYQNGQHTNNTVPTQCQQQYKNDKNEKNIYSTADEEKKKLDVKAKWVIDQLNRIA